MRIAPRTQSRRRPGDLLRIDRAPVLGGVDLVRARFVNRASPPHCHETAEIGVVVSGKRVVICDGRSFVARAGSILLFRPGQVHAGQPHQGTNSTYRSFLVAPDAIRSASTSPHAGWLAGPVLDDRGLARELFETHVALTSGWDRGAGGRLEEAVATLTRQYWPRLPSHGGSAPDWVGRVRRYLDTNYAARIRLATLAQIAGTGVFTMIRGFRAAVGLPPHAYLAQVRVHRAEALLRDGQPASRVAYLTGFADQSHLTRFFTRLVGVPPGRYRRSVLRVTAPSPHSA